MAVNNYAKGQVEFIYVIYYIRHFTLIFASKEALGRLPYAHKTQ